MINLAPELNQVSAKIIDSPRDDKLAVCSSGECICGYNHYRIAAEIVSLTIKSLRFEVELKTE